LERLRSSAGANRLATAGRQLDELLGAIALELATGDAADDAAVLAVRWPLPSRPLGPQGAQQPKDPDPSNAATHADAPGAGARQPA